MTDNKIAKGNLMKEGVLVWVVFTQDGKATLYMDGEEHLENDMRAFGKLLSPDVSAFHEVFNLDGKWMFRHFPKQGVAIRYRIRFRHIGAEDTGIEQSEYEPEKCFPVWIALGETGLTGLHSAESSTPICLIPDITGLPGLTGLHPGDAPIKFEILIREACPFFDFVSPNLLKISSNPECLKNIYRGKGAEGNLMEEGLVMWAVFTKDGKAALYMDGEGRLENGVLAYGEKLSHDMPVLHEICNLKDKLLFRHFPKEGISERIRMRLRFPGTGDAGMEQPGHEPETCFHAWLARDKTGCVGLYMEEPAEGKCAVPEMPGLPELAALQPTNSPIRVEMLVRLIGWFANMAGLTFPKNNRELQ